MRKITLLTSLLAATAATAAAPSVASADTCYVSLGGIKVCDTGPRVPLCETLQCEGQRVPLCLLNRC